MDVGHSANRYRHGMLGHRRLPKQQHQLQCRGIPLNDKLDRLSQLRIDRGGQSVRRIPWPWLAISAVAVAVVIAGWVLLSSPTAKPVTVAVARAATASGASSVLDATGYVTARRQATVSAEITGKIKAVLVEEGMAVEAGQIVAYLDSTTENAQLDLALAQLSSARAALEETRAQLKEAEQTRKRTRDLAERKLVSQADLDGAEANAESLAARLDAGKAEIKVAERNAALLRQLLDETTIRAPFAGVVVAKTAQPGEMISPISAGGGFTRTGICTIVDMDSLEIEVDVNEAYIQRVQAGQRVTATLDAYPDWKIPAEVIAIVPTADRQKATVRVRIGFLERDERVLPDMGIRVAFLDAEPPGDSAIASRLLVPRGAVRNINGDSVVFVVSDNEAEQRKVDVGAVDGQSVLILSGLAAGERVVLEAPDDLSAGDRISIEN